MEIKENIDNELERLLKVNQEQSIRLGQLQNEFNLLREDNLEVIGAIKTLTKMKTESLLEDKKDEKELV